MAEEKTPLKYFPIYHKADEAGADRSKIVRQWVETDLKAKGMIADSEEEANALLVATGDGGMTRAARQYAGSGKIIFGINCGTRGFLLNQLTCSSEIPEYLEDLHTVEVHLMRGTFYTKAGEVSSHLAFNDIFCGGNIADFISFEIQGSLSHFRNRSVKGNGVFLSTPQGTTGFALNARGSSAVLPLDTGAWYIGGVATGPYPNSVFRPQRVEVKCQSRHPVHAYADGYDQEALDIDRIVVEETDLQTIIAFRHDVDFEARRRSLAEAVERGEE